MIRKPSPAVFRSEELNDVLKTLKPNDKRLKWIEDMEDVLKENIHIGKVEYRDLKTDIALPDNIFHKNLRKHMNLKDEKELRAITFKFFDDGGTFLKDAPEGILVSVNLDLLIDKIIISPFAESSLKEKIRSVIQRNNLTKKLKKSSYDDNPLF